MAKRGSKPQPTWTDVKRQLADLNQAGLLSLVQDLYAANKVNQTFLHTRLGLGGDVLKPYKERSDRWISPDIFRKETESTVRHAHKLPADVRAGLVARLDRVRGISHKFGYGVGMAMDEILATETGE